MGAYIELLSCISPQLSPRLLRITKSIRQYRFRHLQGRSCGKSRGIQIVQDNLRHQLIGTVTGLALVILRVATTDIGVHTGIHHFLSIARVVAIFVTDRVQRKA
ncbi:hypothetical protein D3C80_1334300 [compost metagenome]